MLGNKINKERDYNLTEQRKNVNIFLKKKKKKIVNFRTERKKEIIILGKKLIEITSTR